MPSRTRRSKDRGIKPLASREAQAATVPKLHGLGLFSTTAESLARR